VYWVVMMFGGVAMLAEPAGPLSCVTAAAIAGVDSAKAIIRLADVIAGSPNLLIRSMTWSFSEDARVVSVLPTCRMIRDTCASAT